jgi:hypothetical protein
MNLNVFAMTGEYAITLDDGQQVFDNLLGALREEERVTLDFSGVKIVASPFLNAAIGQLLRELDADFLNTHLRIENLPVTARPLLRQVIDNARRYYADPTYRQAVDATIAEQANH